MKKYKGFIAAFYPNIPQFSKTPIHDKESWYANIYIAEADDHSINFQFNLHDNYVARLKKIKTNIFQGDFLQDNKEYDKSIDFIYMKRFDNSHGIMLFGSWREDSYEYDCIVELNEIN